MNLLPTQGSKVPSMHESPVVQLREEEDDSGVLFDRGAPSPRPGLESYQDLFSMDNHDFEDFYGNNREFKNFYKLDDHEFENFYSIDNQEFKHFYNVDNHEFENFYSVDNEEIKNFYNVITSSKISIV